MGTVYRAKCNNCDFGTTFSLGWATVASENEKENTYSLMPGIDSNGKFVIEKFIGPRAAEIKFYCNPEMYSFDCEFDPNRDYQFFINSKLNFEMYKKFHEKMDEYEISPHFFEYNFKYLKYHHNYCPKCKKFTLSFKSFMHFD